MHEPLLFRGGTVISHQYFPVIHSVFVWLDSSCGKNPKIDKVLLQ